MTENQWIEFIAPDAQKAAVMYGYLPSVLIAQTCQETGYGETDLSQPNICNTVGMKAELLNDTWKSMYWNGATYSKRTPEWYGGKKTYITDSFRVYPDYFCGLADFCQFLHDAKDGGKYKYRDLLGCEDARTLIEGVSKRGYCTDPAYADSVMRIIEKHNLRQYDPVKKKVSVVQKPDIIDRIAENAWQVPYHNANDAEYLAIHYLGVNGENPDLYNNGYGGHFYVSKDGRCYQAAKVSDEIWHVGKASYRYIHPDARNSNTIGIECATFTASGRDNDNEPWYFTEETQEACARLAAWILVHYRIPFDHLLRHGDITTKCCPAPYISADRDGFEGQGSNWTWEQFKSRVRAYMGATEGFEIIVGGNHMIEIPQTLKKGDTGKPVFVLEHFLKARGYYKGNLDHSFGDLCDAAVRQFQTDRYKQSGVCLGNSDGTPDGIVGTKTWEDLFGGFDA